MNGKSVRRGNAVTYFAALAVFLLTVALFVGVFWWYGRDSERVLQDREYYFLVEDCEDTTVSAVAGQVYFSGGAGYYIETGGERCVALACYFRLTDAERVLTSLSEKGSVARVLVLGAHDFTLTGKGAAQKSRVEGNLETADVCARILFETANGLERTTLSQEEARAAVRGVFKSLKGLRGGNGAPLFGLWNARLAETERRCEELASGILFAKDLRYLQAELCMAVVNAERYFS